MRRCFRLRFSVLRLKRSAWLEWAIFGGALRWPEVAVEQAQRGACSLVPSALVCFPRVALRFTHGNTTRSPRWG